MTTQLKKNKTTNKDTIREVTDCYGGDKWVQEINELFPFTQLGCINFGYWKDTPDPIPALLREKSQLDLYYKLFAFAKIDKKPRAKVLEVGCGRGHGVHLLSTKGYDAYGIDLVAAQIERCMRGYPTISSKFTRAFSNKTGFESNSLDFVISVEAAQHFYNFFSFVKEGFRILKSGGKVAVTTFFFLNNHSKRDIKDILPEDLSGSHHMISISSAEKFLQKAGFHNIEIQSIGSRSSMDSANGLHNP